MNIIVFGCGRTGATLALQLAHDHNVTVIEHNPEALRRLGYKHNCKVIVGSGLDDEVLERANLRDADVFFAVTRGDNTNIMAAQVARMKFNVGRVCIRVADPNRAEAYRKLGYYCITPSVLTAGYMRHWAEETSFESIDAYNVLPKELEV
jgi:trk system potassium uptake protein TrkA